MVGEVATVVAVSVGGMNECRFLDGVANRQSTGNLYELRNGAEVHVTVQPNTDLSTFATQASFVLL